MFFADNKSSYQYLLDTVIKEFDIDYQNKTILSDQGKSLISLCKDKNILYLICLRHFLVNLRKFLDAYEISVGKLSKFSEVSMHSRVYYQMPSTSDSLVFNHRYLKSGSSKKSQYLEINIQSL